MTTTTTATATRDEQAIRDLIGNWCRALEAKDADGLIAGTAADAHLFDAIPPYETLGAEAQKAAWLQCFPYLPKTIKAEVRDLAITVGGDAAFARYLFMMRPIGEESPCGQSWLRVTVCFARRAGKWENVHSHISLPFDPMTSQIVNIPDPEQGSA